MRPPVNIAGNMQSVPMQGGDVTDPIEDIKGKCLALFHLQNRAEVVTVDAECLAIATCPEIMGRRIERQCDSVFNAFREVRHTDHWQRARGLLRRAPTRETCDARCRGNRHKRAAIEGGRHGVFLFESRFRHEAEAHLKADVSARKIPIGTMRPPTMRHRTTRLGNCCEALGT